MDASAETARLDFEAKADGSRRQVGPLTWADLRKRQAPNQWRGRDGRKCR